MDTSRRHVLQLLGLSAAALATPPVLDALAAGPPAAGPKIGPARGALTAEQWAMVIDTRKFKSEADVEPLVEACHKIHNVPKIDFKRWEIKWLWATEYQHAFSGTTSTRFIADEVAHRPFLVLCNHCENPPCVRACPTKATFKRPQDGIVMMDFHRCIGAFLCGVALRLFGGGVPFSIADVRSQRSALRKIVGLIEKGPIDPDVRRVALQITRGCRGKDDLCELQAIFDAVKHGTGEVPFLRNGLRYVADPRAADFYTGARRILSECVTGSCAGDCDDHTILVGSLCAALGFKVGARAWGPDPSKDVFAHVYCVVWVPKKGPWPSGYTGHGMDTTVEHSRVGWEPPKRRAITAVLEEVA